MPAQIGAKIAEQAAKNILPIARRALGLLTDRFKSFPIAQAVEEAVSVSTTAADGGIWKAVESVRNSLSDDLQILLNTLSSNAKPEHREILDRISSALRRREGRLTDADRNSLLEILGQLAQGKKPEEVILNPTEKLKQMEEKLNAAKQVTNEVASEITGDPDHDVEVLTSVASKVVVKEFSRGNSFWGIAYKWFGGFFLPEEARDINKLPAFIAGELLGKNGVESNFKKALKYYLDNKKVDGGIDLTFTQKHALNGIRFLRWGSQFLSEDMRRRIGEAAYVGDHGGAAALSKMLGGDGITGRIFGRFVHWGYGLFRHYIAGYIDVFNEDIAKINAVHEKYFAKQAVQPVAAATS